MSSCGFPNLSLFYMSIYGGFGLDYGGMAGAYQGLAAGIPQTGNPSFTVADLLGIYPKFFGPATAIQAITDGASAAAIIASAAGINPGQLVTGSPVGAGVVVLGTSSGPINLTGNTTNTSNQVASLSSTNGLLAGMPFSGPGIQAASLIQALGYLSAALTLPATADGVGVALVATGSAMTLSAPTSASGTFTLQVYEAPPVPMAVIQVFINLATASLASSRWRSTWSLAMSLYVAHFLTLWLQSEGNAQTTPGQIVANGLEQGLLVSESADGLSATMQQLEGLASWGAWTKTTYGTQLATFARAVGAGPIYVR